MDPIERASEAERDLEKAQARIAELESALEEPCQACCSRSDDEPAPAAVNNWLQRQITLGFISAEGRKVVEQLLADL